MLLLGDSILVGARDFGGLEGGLRARGWVPEILAEEGRAVSWATGVLETRDRVPMVVVVALGSNPGPGPEGFAADVDALVEALTRRGAARIVWIPPVHADAERYAARQAILSDAARPVEVAGWPARVGRNPGWLSGDGLHLTGDGYAALAAFVVERLSTASAISAE